MEKWLIILGIVGLFFLLMRRGGMGCAAEVTLIRLPVTEKKMRRRNLTEKHYIKLHNCFTFFGDHRRKLI